jgi:TonB family protein
VNEDERALYAVIEKMVAKEPDERFQSAAELEKALAGQEVAPSVVRMKTRMGPPVVLIPGEGPPTPVAKPSAPLEPTVASPAVPPLPPPGEARTVPRQDAEARQGARRVANRSAIMKQGKGGGFPIVLVLLLLAGAGGYWFWSRGKADAGRELGGPDSVAVAKAAAAESLRARADSARSPSTLRPETSRAAAPPPADTAQAPPPVAAAASGDSGAIRIRNLPVGSEVIIDEQRAMNAVTRLPAGSHVVAISAPRHRFYAETVSVHRNDTLLLAPVLTPLGQAAPAATPSGDARQPASNDPCEPGPQWDGTECFDVRPRPLSTPFVALPAGVARVARPAEFWIYVGLSGASEEVRLLRSSGNRAFDRAARAIATSLEWTPAQQHGAAVGAWTQMAFPPSR